MADVRRYLGSESWNFLRLGTMLADRDEISQATLDTYLENVTFLSESPNALGQGANFARETAEIIQRYGTRFGNGGFYLGRHYDNNEEYYFGTCNEGGANSTIALVMDRNWKLRIGVQVLSIVPEMSAHDIGVYDAHIVQVFSPMSRALNWLG